MNDVKIALIQWIWDIHLTLRWHRTVLASQECCQIFYSQLPWQFSKLFHHRDGIKSMHHSLQQAKGLQLRINRNESGNMILKYLFMNTLEYFVQGQSPFYHFFHNQPLPQITRHCGLRKGSECHLNCIPCIFHRWDDEQISWKSEALNSWK